MIDARQLETATNYIQNAWPDARPIGGMILGSGWHDLADHFRPFADIPYADIPGLGATLVSGHAGRLRRARIGNGDEEIWIFQGRRHYYEGVGWTPIAAPIYMLKRAGAGVLLLTNAAGAIDPTFQPGDLMIIEDHINGMGVHPLVGAHDPFWGPRFPDQSRVYDARLRACLRQGADACHSAVRQGVYAACSGPTYETPAEIRALRLMGAHAVGMSTVPEAILANAAGVRVAGLSCMANYAAGVSDRPLHHKEVLESTQQALGIMAEITTFFWKHLPPSTHQTVHP